MPHLACGQKDIASCAHRHPQEIPGGGNHSETTTLREPFQSSTSPVKSQMSALEPGGSSNPVGPLAWMGTNKTWNWLLAEMKSAKLF